MTPAAAAPAATLTATEARVRDIVSARVSMAPAEIEIDRPFALYGLDSVTSAEVVATLERAFSGALPDWVLAEHHTVAALAAYLDRRAESDESPRATSLATLLADARLPDDIAPARADAAMSRVLLTGATGFLGAWVLRELLEATACRVTCLVRGAATPAAGLARVQDNLARYGLEASGLEARVDVVRGDLAQPGLGLDAGARRRLADDIDTIIHVGADVNWVQPYAALRDVNVGGTLGLLRLAAEGRPTSLRFVSSQLVCLVPGGPARVTEDDELIGLADRLPLGYAQTKAVAEALVSAAAARGLRASTFRPALIMGDAGSGVSHHDDFVGALIRGCLAIGAAPDLDWTIDAVPVDHVARAVVHLRPGDDPGVRRVHLSNRRPRHWRECVLWMNLYGYRCALLPHDEWLARLDDESRVPSHALHRLRPFFLKRLAGGLTTPQHYEDTRRATVAAIRSQGLEHDAGLECAPLSADLLDRYFDDYVRRGVLPAPPAARRGAARRSVETGVNVEHRLRRLFAEAAPDAVADRPAADLMAGNGDVALVSSGSEHSILGELTSWRHGRRTGLFHYRVRSAGASASPPATTDVVVKLKAADRDVIEVGQTVADLCGAALGAAYSGASEVIGVRGGHVRELAIYEAADAEARRFMPRCLGSWRDDRHGDWGLALERLTDMALIDAVDDPAAWTPAHLDAAIDGLAALHAAWAPRVDAIAGESWIGHRRTRASLDLLRPLWAALRAHAEPFHRQWAGDDLCDVHTRLTDDVDAWWMDAADMPLTLIHNDCNPRNIALRRDGDGYRLCAYDWELATIGRPQRDLAELLCFVLPDDVDAGTVAAWTERHRLALAVRLGRTIPAAEWRTGLRAAMAEFLVDRVSFYTMIQRVRPQAFLPRVLRTWHRVFAHLERS